MKSTESVNKCFIGIDTSNYTTSFAVCDGKGRVIANIKKLLPVGEGERGLRQSDAVFAHIKNIPQLTQKLRDALVGYTPAAVGYSAYPRDIEGSYMPCFLTGAAVASAVSAVLGVQSFAFSHQSGHIMAALYSGGCRDILKNERFAAFHVSGGTMEIVLVTPSESGSGFHTELIGGTNDLTAGQAIDRIGVAMGFGFPCGKRMEEFYASCRCESDEKHVKPKLSVNGLYCNMSGLENLALKLYSDTSDKAAVCGYVFDFVGKTLDALSDNLRSKYPDIPIVYAGGVMSNAIIREMLEKRDGTYFALPDFSSDNAAGIALLCRERYMQ